MSSVKYMAADVADHANVRAARILCEETREDLIALRRDCEVFFRQTDIPDWLGHSIRKLEDAIQNLT